MNLYSLKQISHQIDGKLVFSDVSEVINSGEIVEIRGKNGMIRVPKGTYVQIFNYSRHLNPELWGEDCEDFNPERKFEGNEIWKRENIQGSIMWAKTDEFVSGQLIDSNYSKIKPDILLLGKALSGGVYPVSAVLADSNVMNCILPGTHGSTFGGNPLAMSVGNAVLDQLFIKNFFKNVTKLSNHFLNELNKIKDEFPKIIKEIRGKGFLIGIQLQFDQSKFIKSLEQNYLLTIKASENVIRVLPPLNVKRNEIDLALKIIKKVCKEYKV